MVYFNRQISFTAKFSLAIICLLFLATCGFEEKKPSADKTTATRSFKLNCVILEKAQIQAWVDSGWTDPKKPDSLIKKILLQFYSTDATNSTENMQLATFPGKNYTIVYAAGRADAVIDTTCIALFPTGKVLFGNSYLSLRTLKILDEAGKLTDFTFIRLRPIQDRSKYGDYVTFKWEVVRVASDNTTTILDEGETSDPCPTFCEETDPNEP